MKSKLVKESLDERMVSTPDGGVSWDEGITYPDLIKIINRTKGDNFTPEDFRNYIDFLIDEGIHPTAALESIKYLTEIHPYILDDFKRSEGPYRDIFHAYIKTLDLGNPLPPSSRIN